MKRYPKRARKRWGRRRKFTGNRICKPWYGSASSVGMACANAFVEGLVLGLNSLGEAASGLWAEIKDARIRITGG